MRVLVTGATGFVGRELVRALVRSGHAVTALVRRQESPESREVARLGAALVAGDVTERATLEAPLRGADALVHAAGVYEFGRSRAARARMAAVNVDGTRHALEVAVAAGVPRIVHVSTVLAFGQTGPVERDESFVRERPPLSEYERTKAEAHEIARALQARGAPVLIVCPGGVVGPGDHSELGTFLRLYVRGFLPPLLYFARGARASVHVEDLAVGIVLALERGRPGETYLLGGPVLCHREMFEIWASAPGGRKPRAFLPDWIAVPLNAAAGPLLRALGAPPLASREFAAVAPVEWRFSSAKAVRELGWTYRDARRTFLDTIDAERSRLAARRAPGRAER